ncbi:unnamed protein product, partial [Tetraodon nigroviridis]
MSRIYHNTSLQNKSVHNEKFDGVWSPSVYESGEGVLLEGRLEDVSRHTISDDKNQKNRFYVLYVRPSRIHQRKFDVSGNEIEPNFSDTKKVNTGFLMSSYSNSGSKTSNSSESAKVQTQKPAGVSHHTEVEATGKSDRLSEDQLSALINKVELVKITDRYRPSGTWAFWYPESEMDKTEMEAGQEVRLKTRGNSPFIFSLAKMDGSTVTKCNFAGDQKAGASWTDKIMANKADAADSQRPGGEGDGVGEDEWV